MECLYSALPWMIFIMTSAMHEVVVIADTSCLIALSNIQGISILRDLYRVVYITPEIADEFGEALPEWIIVRDFNSKDQMRILSVLLDKGEASAISLAFEFEKVLLILDDLKGRKEAVRLGFRITGTLGVLVRARSMGIIPELRPHIEKLLASGFRISAQVLELLLSEDAS